MFQKASEMIHSDVGTFETTYDHWESPIEHMFFGLISARIHRDVRCVYQERIGPYRVDFAFHRGDECVVVELDGKDFHNYSDDAVRDNKLIKEHGVDAVLRIPGSLMFNDRLAVLAAVQEVLPGVLRRKYEIDGVDYSSITWRTR